MTQSQRTVTVNDTNYRWPLRPVVVVCIDGGDPAYLRQFLADGSIPNIARFVREGFAAVADGSMPSFTCPNNMSIITGTPTSRHGISGNFYLDTATWQPVVMTGPELLRGDTIITRFAEAGAKVVSITAKDKLRRQLAKGLDCSTGQVSFSTECVERCTLAENGIENALEWLGMDKPGMYSMELSLFVLEAGIKLLRERRPDLLYLSLTDWVQHKWAPEEEGARTFYRKLDDCIGRLAALDATIALTADHGMNDKSDEAGEPKVIWLQDLLDAKFGAGETTVICPITDAFVAHHGALGGFVRVWSRGRVSARQIIDHIGGIDGIELALDKATACRRRRAAGHLHRRHGRGARPLGPEGPPAAHAWRHFGGQGAVHPQPAAERGLPDEGRSRDAEELAGVRLRDQRNVMTSAAAVPGLRPCRR
jgi:phosphonoacetate hydrolase